MNVLRAWLVRLAGMFSRKQSESEFADELYSHLQMHLDDNLRAGMTANQARRDGILKLGGVESTAQAYRERGTVPFLENLLLDIRFAIRQLRKNPGFACTAILMLALGICTSVAIFAFMDAALIRLLPYRDPPRLVALYESTPSGPRFHLAYLDYFDWKRLNTIFNSLEAYDNNNYLLSTPTGTQHQRANSQRRFLSHAGCHFHPRTRLPRWRGCAQCASDRPAQLQRLAAALRRKLQRPWADGHAQWNVKRHRRRPSTAVSLRSGWICRVLDRPASLSAERPWRTRPFSDSAAQGWHLSFDGYGEYGIDRYSTGEAVSGCRWRSRRYGRCVDRGDRW